MDAASLEMLKGMKVDKAQISMAIDQLQQMGRITPEQAAKAKKDLEGLSQKDVDKYNKMAQEKIANGDADRIINHDYTKSSPKLNPTSDVVKKEPASTAPAQPVPVTPPPTIDFSKLGQ